MQTTKVSVVEAHVNFHNGSAPFNNEVQMKYAREAAYYLGGQYHVCRYTALPDQINNSPTLTEAWKEGREDAAYFESVQYCYHCSTANGDPCIIHD